MTQKSIKQTISIPHRIDFSRGFAICCPLTRSREIPPIKECFLASKTDASYPPCSFPQSIYIRMQLQQEQTTPDESPLDASDGSSYPTRDRDPRQGRKIHTSHEIFRVERANWSRKFVPKIPGLVVLGSRNQATNILLWPYKPSS